MTDSPLKKTLGQSIDEIINALQALDEPTRIVAVRAACDHLNVPLGAVPTGKEGAQLDEISKADLDSAKEKTDTPVQMDISSLREKKDPTGANEMACVVAYYLQNVAPKEERKNSIAKEDLDRCFRQADFPLPKRMEQVLVNTKAAGYLDSTGRGTYRLNAVGYNLVVHTLPRKKAKA
jgi:hypothetical protein